MKWVDVVGEPPKPPPELGPGDTPGLRSVVCNLFCFCTERSPPGGGSLLFYVVRSPGCVGNTTRWTWVQDVVQRFGVQDVVQLVWWKDVVHGEIWQDIVQRKFYWEVAPRWVTQGIGRRILGKAKSRPGLFGTEMHVLGAVWRKYRRSRPGQEARGTGLTRKGAPRKGYGALPRNKGKIGWIDRRGVASAVQQFASARRTSGTRKIFVAGFSFGLDEFGIVKNAAFLLNTKSENCFRREHFHVVPIGEKTGGLVLAEWFWNILEVRESSVQRRIMKALLYVESPSAYGGQIRIMFRLLRVICNLEFNQGIVNSDLHKVGTAEDPLGRNSNEKSQLVAIFQIINANTSITIKYPRQLTGTFRHRLRIRSQLTYNSLYNKECVH